MRKIPVVSGIAAAVVGIAVALLVLLTPSENIVCFEVGSDETIYVMSDYNWGRLLHIVKEDGSARLIPLSKSTYGAECQMLSVGDKVYILGDNEDDFFVSVYDRNGKHLEDAFRMEHSEFGEINDMFIYPNAKYDEETSTLKETDINIIFIVEREEIYSYNIESGKNFSNEKRYVLPENAEVSWAGFSNDILYYMNNEGEFFYVVEGENAVRFEISEDEVPYEPFIFSSVLYFTDLKTGSQKAYIHSKEPDGSYTLIENETYLAEDAVIGSYIFSDLRKVKGGKNWFESGNTGSLVGLAKNGGERGKIVAFGMLDKVMYDEPLPGAGIAVISFLICAFVSFAVFCGAALIVRYVLSIRKLVVKQILAFLLIMVITFFPVWFTIRTIIQDIVDQQLIGASVDFSVYVEKNIDIEKFSKEGLTDEERRSIRNYEHEAVEGVIPWTLAYLNLINRGNLYSIVKYVDVARIIDGEYYYEYYAHQKPGGKVSYFYDEETLRELMEVNSNEVVLKTSNSYNKEWMEIIRPLIDKNGEQAGFVQVGYDYSSLRDRVSKNSMLIALWVMALLVFAAFVMLMTVLKLLKPLKQIRRAVTEISEGKIGATVSVKSNDELQDIAYSFSEMSRKLEKYFNSINVISKAYERFLPKDFFRLMGKKNVLDVKPSDRKEIDLTYLFVGIDLYDVHQKGGDSFKAINRIFGAVSDAVITRGGAIKNIDDNRITAIFSTPPMDAVEAGLTIPEKMRAFAEESAEITVTVQRAPSTIGVIGTQDAMDSIVVSEAVNLQQYIGDIMKKYKLEYVIAENAVKDLTGLNITLRYIGNLSDLCYPEELRYDAGLYEVLDGCRDSVKTLKMATLTSFNKGITALLAGDFIEARRNIIDVLRVNRADLVAEYYLLKIDEITSKGGGTNERKHGSEISAEV